MNRQFTFIVHPETAEQKNALKAVIDRLKIKFEISEDSIELEALTNNEKSTAQGEERNKMEAELHIPEWQKQEVRERLERYKKNPDQAFDFESTVDDIDKDL